MTHGSRFKVTSAKVPLVLMCVLTCDVPDGERDLVSAAEWNFWLHL